MRCKPGLTCVNGNCIPLPGLCGIVICDKDEVCINGQCTNPLIDISCANIKCDASNGFYCRNGACVRDCNALKTQCAAPRPNDKTCPPLYYIAPPKPTVCGVTSSGQLVNYVRDC